MKYSSVLLLPDGADNVEIPMKEVPVTLDYDFNKVIGFAKLRKHEGQLIADITINSDISISDQLPISLGGRFKKTIVVDNLALLAPKRDKK